MIRSFTGWEYLGVLLIAVAVALLLRYFVIFPVAVNGPSMQPTLYNKDVVMVEKISKHLHNIARFDVVIVDYPGHDELFVKRVIGLPGETIKVENGRVYINGEALDDPYCPEIGMLWDTEEQTVPEDCYFVMGDNRNDSSDSRNPLVGPIPWDAIHGRVLLRIWPLSGIKFLH